MRLDPSQFNAEQKKAGESFLKTKKEAERQAKDIEAAGKRASEAFYGRLKREALGFFAVLAGAAGLKEFIAQVTAADAATGRMARNLGLSGQTLSAWGGAVGRLGGSAEGLAGSFQSFSNSIQELKTTGNTGILPWLYRLRAAGGRQIDLNKSLDESFLDIGHNIHEIAKNNPQLAYFYGKQLGLDAGTVNLLNQSDEALRKIIEDSRKFAARPEDTQAAAKRQYEWSRLSQIFMSLGRTITTDLSPVLIGLTRILEILAEGLNQVAIKAPVLVDGFAALLALWSGAKIVSSIRTMLALKNALLGIAEAETAVAVAGEGAAGKGLLGLLSSGSFMARLGLLGASAYALYETVKPQSLNEGENSGVWPTGRDPTQVGGAAGKWWTAERYGHAVDRLMKEAGLSHIGAQGLVARWMNVEAPGGPGSVSPKSGAFGIGQWLGGRKGGIAGNTDFDGQISYAIRELNSSESRAGRALRSASTPDQAARGASMYERAEGYDPRSGTDAFTNAVANALRRLPPSRLPNVASGAAGSASFGRSADNRVSNSSNAETHIGTVVVHTKATDAKGIAQDIKPALQRFPLTVNANYGPA